MADIDDGGPAFPAPDLGDMEFGARAAHSGMTLRDYFAAKAMQGDIASMESHQDPSAAATTIAMRAYQIADAMLRERAK